MSAHATVQATCPKCNGTTRRKVPALSRPWATSLATYDKATDTLACDNCGGQRMELKATGQTRIDPTTGLGCLHAYTGRIAGNCYTVYTCAKCGDSYGIDSSD